MGTSSRYMNVTLSFFLAKGYSKYGKGFDLEKNLTLVNNVKVWELLT